MLSRAVRLARSCGQGDIVPFGGGQQTSAPMSAFTGSDMHVDADPASGDERSVGIGAQIALKQADSAAAVITTVSAGSGVRGSDGNRSSGDISALDSFDQQASLRATKDGKLTACAHSDTRSLPQVPAGPAQAANRRENFTIGDMVRMANEVSRRTQSSWNTCSGDFIEYTEEAGPSGGPAKGIRRILSRPGERKDSTEPREPREKPRGQKPAEWSRDDPFPPLPPRGCSSGTRVLGFSAGVAVTGPGPQLLPVRASVVQSPESLASAGQSLPVQPPAGQLLGRDADPGTGSGAASSPLTFSSSAGQEPSGEREALQQWAERECSGLAAEWPVLPELHGRGSGVYGRGSGQHSRGGGAARPTGGRGARQQTGGRAGGQQRQSSGVSGAGGRGGGAKARTARQLLDYDTETQGQIVAAVSDIDISVREGRPFDSGQLSPAVRAALTDGRVCAQAQARSRSPDVAEQPPGPSSPLGFDPALSCTIELTVSAEQAADLPPAVAAAVSVSRQTHTAAWGAQARLAAVSARRLLLRSLADRREIIDGAPQAATAAQRLCQLVQGSLALARSKTTDSNRSIQLVVSRENVLRLLTVDGASRDVVLSNGLAVQVRLVPSDWEQASATVHNVPEFMSHTDVHAALSALMQVRDQPLLFTLQLQEAADIDAELMRALSIREVTQNSLSASNGQATACRAAARVYQVTARRDAICRLPSALTVELLDSTGSLQSSQLLAIRGTSVKGCHRCGHRGHLAAQCAPSARRPPHVHAVWAATSATDSPISAPTAVAPAPAGDGFRVVTSGRRSNRQPRAVTAQQTATAVRPDSASMPAGPNAFAALADDDGHTMDVECQTVAQSAASASADATASGAGGGTLGRHGRTHDELTAAEDAEIAAAIAESRLLSQQQQLADEREYDRQMHQAQMASQHESKKRTATDLEAADSSTTQLSTVITERTSDSATHAASGLTSHTASRAKARNKGSSETTPKVQKSSMAVTKKSKTQREVAARPTIHRPVARRPSSATCESTRREQVDADPQLSEPRQQPDPVDGQDGNWDFDKGPPDISSHDAEPVRCLASANPVHSLGDADISTSVASNAEAQQGQQRPPSACPSLPL